MKNIKINSFNKSMLYFLFDERLWGGGHFSEFMLSIKPKLLEYWWVGVLFF